MKASLQWKPLFKISERLSISEEVFFNVPAQFCGTSSVLRNIMENQNSELRYVSCVTSGRIQGTLHVFPLHVFLFARWVLLHNVVCLVFPLPLIHWLQVLDAACLAPFSVYLFSQHSWLVVLGFSSDSACCLWSSQAASEIRSATTHLFNSLCVGFATAWHLTG